MNRTAILALAALSACSTTPAERATFDAIAPAHAVYVTTDLSLTPEQVQRRLDLLEAWRVRVGAPAVVWGAK